MRPLRGRHRPFRSFVHLTRVFSSKGGADSATAHQAWDKAWATEQGRGAWLSPAPQVVNVLPLLRSRGVTKALDLGCGVGRHSLFLAKQGLSVHALDASAHGLSFLRSKAESEGIKVIEDELNESQAGMPKPLTKNKEETIVVRETPRLVVRQGPMTHLPENWSFDYVLAWNVVYHGTRPVVKQTLNEIGRVLKAKRKDGIFHATFLSTSNHLFGKGQEIEHHTFVIPDSDDEDKKHPHHYLSAEELEQLLRECVFRVTKLDHFLPPSKPGHWHFEVIAETA